MTAPASPAPAPTSEPGDGPLVLGIESTCDETGVALVRGRTLLADVTASSMDAHARFGGIVPEVASRAHLEAFVPTLDAALERLFTWVLDNGGAITGEHGVGLAKLPWIERALGPASLAVHRALKKTLDPNHILNPGKMLPGGWPR